MKKSFIILIVLGLMAGGIWLKYPQTVSRIKHYVVRRWEDWKKERHYRQLIRIEMPRAGETVSNPLIIKGKARGNWFFEASFLVRLLDAKGQEWVIGLAEAEGDWMTKDFVPFLATVDWVNLPPNLFGEKKDPAVLFGQPGTLILEKANPSDLPENDDQYRIPIIFGRP